MSTKNILISDGGVSCTMDPIWYLLVIVSIILDIVILIYILSPFLVERVYIDPEIRKLQAHPLKFFPRRWQIRPRRSFTTLFNFVWLPLALLGFVLIFLENDPDPSYPFLMSDPWYWISIVVAPLLALGIVAVLIHLQLKKERWMLEIRTDTGEVTVRDPHNRRVSTTLDELSEIAFVRRSRFAERKEWEMRWSRGMPRKEFFPTLFIKGEDGEYLVRAMALKLEDYMNLRTYCRQKRLPVLDQYGKDKGIP